MSAKSAKLLESALHKYLLDMACPGNVESENSGIKAIDDFEDQDRKEPPRPSHALAPPITQQRGRRR